MKQIGIWLDKEKAHVVTLHHGDETFETIQSELEFFNPKGGSRSKTRWGPQEVVQDSRYLEREKQQLQRYFDRIISIVGKADELGIFGPAETGKKLEKFIEEKHPLLTQKVKTVKKADSMTDNQIKALVRDFFAGSG